MTAADSGDLAHHHAQRSAQQHSPEGNGRGATKKLEARKASTALTSAAQKTASPAMKVQSATDRSEPTHRTSLKDAACDPQKLSPDSC